MNTWDKVVMRRDLLSKEFSVNDRFGVLGQKSMCYLIRGPIRVSHLSLYYGDSSSYLRPLGRQRNRF